MFDIGIAELAVVAVVALVILGPERLPEVMRQAGRWYRKAMDFRAELMAQAAEAQRAFRDEIEAVERAANLDLSAVTPPDPALPPPPLRQVPAYRRQTDLAHEAGPFGLAAWYRDPSPDVDVPALAGATASPLALRPVVGDTLLGHSYVTSTRTLTAPVHPFDDPFDDPFAPGRPTATGSSRAVAGLAAKTMGVAPAVVVAATAPASPALMSEGDAARASREGTVITLFEAGLHTRESASGVLEISVAEFDRRLAARREAPVVAVA